MTFKLSKEKITIWFYIVIGSIGAFGEAILIRHELVDCYPYKVSRYSNLYDQIANTGFFLIPIVAIGITLFFVSEKRFWTTAMPAFLCPLIFLLLFEYFTWTNPAYGEDVRNGIKDFSSVEANRQFVTYIFQLSLKGLVTGLLCGGFIFALQKVIFSMKFKKDLR